MIPIEILESELLTVAARCAGLISGYTDVEGKCDAIEEQCDWASRAFSGSFLGYHSCVYYRDFNSPPPSAYFDVEGGLQHEEIGSNTRGDWIKMGKEVVIRLLLNKAAVSDIREMEKLKTLRTEGFLDIQSQLRSVSSRFAAQITLDSFLQEEMTQALALAPRSLSEIGSFFEPRRKIATRDTLAVQEGNQAPPHLILKAKAIAIREPYLLASRLEKIARWMARHLKAARTQGGSAEKSQGNKIFIGHGRSEAWRQLKDFLEDDLHLEPDEFNRQPSEGLMIGERLGQMLEEACFAFIVCTAEDDRGDAKLYPRLNVVHEAGLFQGRLGFKRAIILLEDGCEKFSNIDGLVVLPFSFGRIDGTFDRIRRLLASQGLLR